MADEIKFKVGDVVKLKSGGQPMTINKFVYDDFNKKPFEDRVECVWFEGKKFLREKIFITSLKHTSIPE